MSRRLEKLDSRLRGNDENNGQACGLQLIQTFALHAIQIYQQAVSPYLPSVCRHSPSCSEYAHEAISKYGLVKGCWLAVRRLGRCRPLGTSGYDPVP